MRIRRAVRVEKLKPNLWWVLPSINLGVFIPHLLGYKASMCEHVIYAIVGQVLLLPAFPFMWGLEKTFDVAVHDIVAVFISSAFYMLLGWGISKTLKDANA